MPGLILAILPLIVLTTEFVKDNLNSFAISSILVAILIIIRILTGKPLLSNQYRKIYAALTILLIVATCIGLMVTLLTYQNFIYSKTFIRIEVLSYFVAISIPVWFIQNSNEFLSKKIRIIFTLAPFVYSIVIGFFHLLPNNLLFNLSLEDSFIENLQVTSLIIGGFGGILVGLNLLKKRIKSGSIIFIGGLILMFIAGEEISWGQRIFDFVNHQLQSVNIQNETNIHNLRSIHFGIPLAYSVIGFFGSVGSVVINHLKLFSKDHRKYLVPEVYLFFFFFIPFLYNITTLEYGPLTEASELLLYTGVSLFLIQSKIFVKK